MSEIFSEDYIIDNSAALNDTLTEEYELQELNIFFKNSNIQEPDSRHLRISDVNISYPIEIVRSGHPYGLFYSVYRVTQGGYYYVFWTTPRDTNDLETTLDPIVSFSAYVARSKSPDDFDSLTIGINTAADVKDIDPYVEFCFTMSSGRFSYSYLDRENVLEIEYELSVGAEALDDWVVKSIMIRPTSETPSHFGYILPKDFP